MRLELLGGHGQILAVQSVGLSLLAANCLDISLKFREERFSHSCEFALGLSFLIDKQELEVSDFLLEVTRFENAGV